MEFAKKEFEMRGMKRIEIVNYFITIGGEKTSDENLFGKGWNVQIDQEKLVALGSFKVPATVVILSCRKDLIDKMVWEFNLRFLSAGG